MDFPAVKLTQYSHGAGCGCKIAPAVLDKILHTDRESFTDSRLLVGNASRDDAAVWEIGNGQCLISTTDFFMPIVDDPFEFGRIASANAISDVYAMGGTPVLAIAILGWPIGKIPEEIASAVMEGSRDICTAARISLAGGHSIDSPEPIFGLAVNGLVQKINLRKNDTAKPGDLLFLTKPIGIGAITTAQKKGLVSEADIAEAVKWMTTLNSAGAEFGKHAFVHAMTDVTGFGLLGHLREMADGSGLAAEVWYDAVPKIGSAEKYIRLGCVPGGTDRNWKSYGHAVSVEDDAKRNLLCDPQTSGGLLVAADPDAEIEMRKLFATLGIPVEANPIGVMRSGAGITVK